MTAQFLSPEELVRYGRHLALPEVGPQGQLKLKQAGVLLVGAGGLGSPLGLYLAAAGVGRLGLIDFDTVDASNLQRQILYGTRDVGRAKCAAAAERLRDLNPQVALELHETRLTRHNALDLLRPYDVIVDGTDNFATRYLVNDACVLLGKPNVYGSVYRFEGQVSVLGAPGGPCYRCLYPAPPPPGAVPNCAEGGVLGVLPGIIGALQANEVLKLLLGIGEPLIGRLLLFDALQLHFRELKFARNPACPVCGTAPTIRELLDLEAFCGAPAEPAEPCPEITPHDLQTWLAEGRAMQIIDVREPDEFATGQIPRARLISLGEIVARRGELDPTQPAVLHCLSGKRSALAIRKLREAGYTGPLLNLQGGIAAWQAAEAIDATPRQPG
jgi:adenylyltransferase/sulfurtransferase